MSARLVGALGRAASALVVGLACACLPNPQSVAERRAEFPRASLMGSLVLTAPPPGMTEVGAVFGDRIKLVGYTLDPERPKRGVVPGVSKVTKVALAAQMVARNAPQFFIKEFQNLLAGRRVSFAHPLQQGCHFSWHLPSEYDECTRGM